MTTCALLQLISILPSDDRIIVVTDYLILYRYDPWYLSDHTASVCCNGGMDVCGHWSLLSGVHARKKPSLTWRASRSWLWYSHWLPFRLRHWHSQCSPSPAIRDNVLVKPSLETPMHRLRCHSRTYVSVLTESYRRGGVMVFNPREIPKFWQSRTGLQIEQKMYSVPIPTS